MHPWRATTLTLIAAVVLSSGCGRKPPAADDAAFRAAIERYLESHNMALAIKEMKDVPDPSARELQLRASLVHKELSGPSVTWTFHFRQESGNWSVVRHED